MTKIIETDLSIVEAFLGYVDALHWLWTFDGTIRASVWVSKEFGIQTDVAWEICASLFKKLQYTEEFQAMKPQEIVQWEKDFENTPKQNYEFEDIPREKIEWKKPAIMFTLVWALLISFVFSLAFYAVNMRCFD